jgi:hypothetical protein
VQEASARDIFSQHESPPCELEVFLWCLTLPLGENHVKLSFGDGLQGMYAWHTIRDNHEGHEEHEEEEETEEKEGLKENYEPRSL